jgi:hypothetical protein
MFTCQNVSDALHEWSTTAPPDAPAAVPAARLPGVNVLHSLVAAGELYYQPSDDAGEFLGYSSEEEEDENEDEGGEGGRSRRRRRRHEVRFFPFFFRGEMGVPALLPVRMLACRHWPL